MSLDQIMMVLLLVYAAALTGLITIQIISSSVYDLKFTRQQRRRQAHPYAKTNRQRPLVTIIIMAQNQAAALDGCLDSLRRGTYRKLQVLILDNASTDDIKTIAREYIKKHPHLEARLISKRQVGAWPETINSVRRHIRGELVLLLDAGSQVDKYAVKRAIEQYQTNPEVNIFVPRLMPAEANSMRDLVRSYISMLGQRSRKAGSLLNRPQTPDQAIMCRREAMNALLKGKPTSSIYIDNVNIYASSASATFPKLKQPSSSSRLQYLISRVFMISQSLVTVLTPILVSYFLYLAIGLREPTFLLLSMGGLALLILFAIWESEQLRFRQRLAYTLGIPVTFSLFFVTSWVRFITACQTLITDT